jgi:uncharacterized protein (DUF1501 family)
MMSNRDGRGISRRDALKRGLLGAAALATARPAALLAQAGEAAALSPQANSVIQIWMWGGPAHLDTFDPKPEAGYDYTGPLNKAIPTNVAGIQIGQSLPKLAQLADKYSVLRSMTHGVNAHETASYLVQTGRQPSRLVFPSVGAVVARMRGYEAGYKGIAPPYIVLTEPQGRFSEAGFLGQRYKPFATGGDPNQKRFAVEGIVAPGISDDRQRARRALMHELDSLGDAMPVHPEFAAWDDCEDQAYGMMFGEVRDLFDLSKEDGSLRDRYGRNTFGQSCLMARRLAEAGVPYITINYKGWDTHKQHFQIMGRKLPELDQGMATLLEDLTDRGLLDTTVVWWGGEFGRTPQVQWEPPWNGGRGHHGQCFSSVVAGGGFRGGEVVGASDEVGAQVAQRPVYPHDLIGSIYNRLGIDPEGTLPNPRGLDVRVLPTAEDGVPRAGLLEEIML